MIGIGRQKKMMAANLRETIQQERVPLNEEIAEKVYKRALELCLEKGYRLELSLTKLAMMYTSKEYRDVAEKLLEDLIRDNLDREAGEVF